MILIPFTSVGHAQSATHEGLASTLAVISAIVGVFGLVYALAHWWNTPTSFKSVATSDDLRKALDVRIELASKLFDLSLLMLGVVWGFILVDKVAIDLSRWQNLVLFISSNVLILISLFSHLVYRLHLANVMWSLAGPLAPKKSDGSPDPQLPDITETYIETPFNIQWVLFFISLVSVLCIVLVVKLLGG
jgi:hypothetical protein